MNVWYLSVMSEIFNAWATWRLPCGLMNKLRIIMGTSFGCLTVHVFGSKSADSYSNYPASYQANLLWLVAWIWVLPLIIVSAGNFSEFGIECGLVSLCKWTVVRIVGKYLSINNYGKEFWDVYHYSHPWRWQIAAFPCNGCSWFRQK